MLCVCLVVWFCLVCHGGSFTNIIPSVVEDKMEEENEWMKIYKGSMLDIYECVYFGYNSKIGYLLEIF